MEETDKTILDNYFWFSTQSIKLILVELIFIVLPVLLPNPIQIWMSRWNRCNFVPFWLQKLCPSIWKTKRWFVMIACPLTTLFWWVLPGRCFCFVNRRPLKIPARDLDPLMFLHYAKNPQLYFIWFWQGNVCILHIAIFGWKLAGWSSMQTRWKPW